MLDLSQRLIEKRAPHGEVGLHLGEAELRILEIENALTERLAILDELQGERERQLCGRQISRAFRDPHVVQHTHDLFEPASLATTEQTVRAHAYILRSERERQLCGRQISRAFRDPHVVQHTHDLFEPASLATTEQTVRAHAYIL